MRRRNLAVWTIGALLVAAAFVLTRIQGGFIPWFVFDFALVAWLYELVVWWHGGRGVVIERRLSSVRVAAGSVLDVAIRLTRRGLWPALWLRIREEMPEGLRPEAGGDEWWLFPWRPGEHELRHRLRAERRGVYELPPVRMETGDMFGLQRTVRQSGDPVKIIVHPAIAPVRVLGGERRLPADARQQTVRRAEESTELAGVREWSPGDRLGRVHWPTTARMAQLHSKAFELQSMGGWVFVADALQSSYAARPVGDATFELTMSITASLIAHAAQRKWPAQLWMAGDRWRELPLAGSPALALEALDLLAMAAPGGSGRWATQLQRLARRIPAGAAVVLVSPQVTKEAASVLSALAARHPLLWLVPSPHGDAGPSPSELATLAEAGVGVRVIRRPQDLAYPGRGGLGREPLATVRT